MFKWFSGGNEGRSGLEKMKAEFGQMLDAGRHVFDAAANAFLGGTDVEIIRKDLFATDKRINYAEQRIRREIVVHATVHGPSSFPECLVLMSVVKDAERLGDYSKNIFDLAELAPKKVAGEHKEDLVELKDRISNLMGRCREVFDTQDEADAKSLIAEAEAIEDRCDAQLSKIISESEHEQLSATYALAYRYFKRVASHSLNVLTSIVQPLDKLDYSDTKTDAEQ